MRVRQILVARLDDHPMQVAVAPCPIGVDVSDVPWEDWTLFTPEEARYLASLLLRAADAVEVPREMLRS